MSRKLRIGTERSQIALWQANTLKESLTALGHLVELAFIDTNGNFAKDDANEKDYSNSTVKLQEALAKKQIDLAVHSLKNLETKPTAGLILAGVSKRKNPSEVFIIRSDRRENSRILSIKTNAHVSTGSLRQKAQILDFRPDLNVVISSSSLSSRIKLLMKGDCDAIVAAAGEIESTDADLSEYMILEFSPKEFIPEAAQGVLAYQLREENLTLRKIILDFHNEKTAQCTNVERQVLKMIGDEKAHCLGVYCEKDTVGNFHVFAALEKNKQLLRAKLSQSTTFGMAEALYKELIKED